MKEEAPNQETKRAVKYLKLSELSQEVIDDIAEEFLEIAGGHNTGGNLQLDNIKNFLDKKGKASFRWGSSKLSNPHSKFSISTLSVLENGDKLIKFSFEPNLGGDKTNTESAAEISSEFQNKVQEYLNAKNLGM